jgi:hypothetical protein
VGWNSDRAWFRPYGHQSFPSDIGPLFQDVIEQFQLLSYGRAALAYPSSRDIPETFLWPVA